MSASLYTYITSPYHSVIFPNGHLEPPDWEHFRTLSSLLSLNPNQLRSPIGPEVLPFIHGNYQFSARIYPDAPINFDVIIDINPLNYSPTLSLILPDQSRLISLPTTFAGTYFLVQFPPIYVTL